MGRQDERRRPRAVIILVSPRCTHTLAPVEWDTPCDLDLVHRLLWLHLRAKRMGWSLRLTDVDNDLRRLIELVGVSSSLLPER